MTKKLVLLIKICLIASLITSIFLGSVYAELEKQVTAQLTSKQIPAPVALKEEAIVFSFYDTQLEVVCYLSNTGIDCLLRKSLSKHAKLFIDDRVIKYRKNLGLGNKIPRIVPLDQ